MNTRKPDWLRLRLPSGPEYEQTRQLLRKGHLHTVCQEAQCPNIFECFARHTATFLILGNRCTRSCTFCAVQNGPRCLPDPDEPDRVARAVADLGLSCVVITSVTRDDLPDGGAAAFAATIKTIGKTVPQVRLEVLIPDFQGNENSLYAVLDAGPDVLNHNIETVPRLYPTVRPQADYRLSLQLLLRAGTYKSEIPTKSGMMLGLGETEKEIENTLRDLREAGCRIVTLGQYLQPTKANHPVKRFVPPEEFEHWRAAALALGFEEAASGPFVRSSYRAQDSYRHVCGDSSIHS
jgi:lipoyl synthase